MGRPGRCSQLTRARKLSTVFVIEDANACVEHFYKRRLLPSDQRAWHELVMGLGGKYGIHMGLLPRHSMFPDLGFVAICGRRAGRREKKVKKKRWIWAACCARRVGTGIRADWRFLLLRRKHAVLEVSGGWWVG